MEGPALKRPKLQLGDVQRDDWLRWTNNLETLQLKLASGCLCHVETLELQRPISPTAANETSQATSTSVDMKFLRDYTLQFISTIHFLGDTALKQQTKGFICKKIMDMASGVAMDEGIWEMLIEYLDSSDRFITLATSKCLVSLLMWTKLPNLNEIFDELFKSVMITTNNPFKLSRILDLIRGVVEYKYESDHPLELEEESQQGQDNSNPNDVNMLDLSNSSSNSNSVSNNVNSGSSTSASDLTLSTPRCFKVEVDTEIDSEVKTLCVKALENWWGRLLEKFQNMMAHFDPINESPISTFLSLWLSIISVKYNLSVIDTKHYYMHLEAFVPLLNPNSPALVWKKLTDVFNEILCYGSTLSLQDVPNEEPCDLAHLIIRLVRSRQFLQGIPYSRAFTGFGGSLVGPVDWEWESESKSTTNRDDGHSKIDSSSPAKNTGRNPSSSGIQVQPDLLPAIPSSSKSLQSLARSQQPQPTPSPTTSTKFALSLNPKPSTHKPPTFPHANAPSTAPTNPSPSKREPILITQTIYIGPSREVLKLDESFGESCGDRPLLQKVVLLVLKSVAVTVQETRADDYSDGGSDDDNSLDSMNSGSESEANDMVFVEKSIREVFKELDSYVKSLQPFHPEAPLGEWMVKLFADQDDSLIEAMLCVLDTYRGFLTRSRVELPPDFKLTFHPVKTFITFLTTISNDKDILLDWLMGNETCFLLYILTFLKFAYKNWSEFVSYCDRELENTMGVLIRLRMGVGRLVERSLFPYNINPVLRLLERCEELYETNGGNNS